MFYIFLAQFIKYMQKLAHISIIPLGFSEQFCSVTLNSVYRRVCVLLLLPWALIARVTTFQTELWIEAAVGRLCITAEVVEGRHCISAGLCGSVTILSNFCNASQAWGVLEVTKGCVKVFLAHCLMLDANHQRAIGEKAKHLHPCVQLLKFTLDCG